MANYRKTRAGMAQYNFRPPTGAAICRAPEGCYLEWYNSPEQQAIRDREAGLIQILLVSQDLKVSILSRIPNSPVAGMQTNGQLALEGINTAII